MNNELELKKIDLKEIDMKIVSADNVWDLTDTIGQIIELEKIINQVDTDFKESIKEPQNLIKEKKKELETTLSGLKEKAKEYYLKYSYKFDKVNNNTGEVSQKTIKNLPPCFGIREVNSKLIFNQLLLDKVPSKFFKLDEKALLEAFTKGELDLPFFEPVPCYEVSVSGLPKNFAKKVEVKEKGEFSSTGEKEIGDILSKFYDNCDTDKKKGDE